MIYFSTVCLVNMAVKEKIVFLKVYYIGAVQYSLYIVYDFIGIFYDRT